MSQADRVEFRELDVKVQGIEDEVDSLRMGTQTEARSLVDQISNVETSLAQDIEAVADSRPSSRTSNSDRTSNWSGLGGSFRSFSTDITSTQREHVAVNEALNRSSNIDRSIILSNIRERQGESLKLLVLDCVNDIGLNLKPEDIEMVYRIGDANVKKVHGLDQ